MYRIYIGEGNGYTLQYSCLENSMDRGVWQSIGSQRVGHVVWYWGGSESFFPSPFTSTSRIYTLKLQNATERNQRPKSIELCTMLMDWKIQHNKDDEEVIKIKPFPSLGDLLNPRIKSGSPALKADSVPSEPPGKPPQKLHVLGSIHWNYKILLKEIKDLNK